jgi:hypothetical protein
MAGVAAAVVALPAVAYGQLYLGLEAGQFTGDSAVMDGYPGSKLGGAPVLGARLGYALTSGLGHGVSVDLGWRRFTSRVRVGSSDYGTVQITPITLALSYVYRPPSGRGVGAHVGMGAGPLLTTFAGGPLLTGSRGTAFDFPVGVEFHFSRWASAGAEIRLLMALGETATVPGRAFDFQAVEREVLATVRLWIPGT